MYIFGDMLDNFELIKPLLKFDSSDDYYMIQILQRRKENPTLRKNAINLQNYYVTSHGYLELIKDEVIKMCEAFNARASIYLNRRSFKQTAYLTLSKISEQFLSGDYRSVKDSYLKAAASHYNDPNKTWVVDIDETDLIDDEMIELINASNPLGNKIMAKIPSKTGVHLIVNGFDSREFKKRYPEVEIHRNNPTNLFIFEA